MLIIIVKTFHSAKSFKHLKKAFILFLITLHISHGGIWLPKFRPKI